MMTPPDAQAATGVLQIDAMTQPAEYDGTPPQTVGVDWLHDLVITHEGESTRPASDKQAVSATVEDELELLRNEDAHDSVLEGVKRIEESARKADQWLALADARLRLFVRKLERIDLAELPNWLNKVEAFLTAIQEVHDGDIPFFSVLETTENLVRAAVKLKPDAMADVEPTEFGSMEVIWENKYDLRWLVEPSKVGWPAVRVRAFRTREVGDRKLEAQIFRTAHTLLEHFSEAYELDVPEHESEDGSGGSGRVP